MDDLSSPLAPTSNQYFLVSFIIGLYFGPDLIEGARKSVLQRWGEGLPPCTLDQLAGSCLRIEKVCRVYYFVLQKTDKFLALEPYELHEFFLGKLPSPWTMGFHKTSYPHFDDLFPSHLHPRVQCGNRCEMVDNIVFIHNPDFSCIKPGDVERFKRLTGLESLRLDRARALSHQFIDSKISYDDPLEENSNYEDLGDYHSAQPLDILPYDDASPGVIGQNNILTFTNPFLNTTPQMTCGTVSSPAKTTSSDDPEPRMICLPSRPPRKVWNNIVAATECGFTVSGSAAMGNVGPVLGLVDIGESEDSYLFRVSLPGVKRSASDFSCEVENDGKVIISGVTTTGEQTVYRDSHAFRMQSQNLCPSGDFSISFHLPGPVNPYHFSGNFGTDGILEVIVMKLA